MKKKLLCLLMAGTMMVSVCGCGGEVENVATTESSVVEGTDVEAETPTAEPEQLVTEPIEIAKSELGNPIGGFNAEGELTYGGDPSVLVDGDTVYLYTGRDTAVGDAYLIPDYQCYSTTDLVNWTYEGVVLSMSDVTWADRNAAWAGQVAKHYDAEAGKDMYYFYFCSWDKTDKGKQSIGVAVSESPTGPFTDIGEALVKGSFTTDETSAWNDIDPTVWIEKDETGEEHRYLCWGNSKLYMCELNEDMISVKDYDGDGEILFDADVRKQSMPTLFTEAPWLYRRQDENGNYYGDYYLFYAYGWREQLAYATAGTLMKSSWEFQDYLMDPTATSNTNHPAVFDFQGKTYMIYHNGSLPHGNGYRRVACIEELQIDDDGYVNFVTETATGISGVKSTLTAANGEVLAHAWFVNSGADTAYPYTNVELGSNLDKAKVDDAAWEIVPGKADEENVYYVSIEAYNKPGLYITASEGAVGLTQDTTGKMADVQTFKTVKGLSGEGVSFESVAFAGMYLTLTGGKASLTDGTDAAACSFVIE
ncbi:MAG: family 43 glycosylhydrolase [Lachnospiraceae bacterium]|nr:family 43 glycosylhydrolase [Lachnospiraceae bacterium]